MIKASRTISVGLVVIIIKESEDAQVSWQRYVASFAEVVGVSIVGFLLTAIVISSMGLSLSTGGLLPTGPDPDYVGASITLAIVLVIQYVCLLGPAFVIGYWYRRRSVTSYGLTTGARSLGYLILLGVLGFAVANLPAAFVKVAQDYVPAGPIPVTHDWFQTADWTRWDFWLFLAVGSYALVPVVEELFFRGYIQTRLAEDFGGAGAVVISSSIFTFGHVQYLYVGVYSVANLIAVFLAGLVFGYLYYRTRSLIPSIIAHAIANVPVPVLGRFVLISVMLVLVVLFRKWLVRGVQGFVQDLGSMPVRGVVAIAALLGAIYASMVGFSVTVIFILGIVLLPIALILEYREKRQRIDTD